METAIPKLTVSMSTRTGAHISNERQAIGNTWNSSAGNNFVAFPIANFNGELQCPHQHEHFWLTEDATPDELDAKIPNSRCR